MWVKIMFSVKLGSSVCIVLLLFLIAFLLSSCFPRGRREVPTVEITIENPLPIKRTDVPIVLKLSEIRKVAEDFSFDLSYIITPSERPKRGQQPDIIASQADDMDYDGVKDEMIFLVDLEPEEVKTLLIRYAPEGEEEVEVRLIPKYTKQTKTGIFPELGGAALESKLAAYLINSQNAIYPLGKSSSGLMLNRYAKSKDETEMFPIVDQDKQDWVGCGGFAFWKDNILLPIRSNQSERYARVLSDGPVRAAVEVIYPDSNTASASLDIRATISIIAGHREIKNQIKVKGDTILPQIATGLPYALTDNNREEGYAYNWNSYSSIGTALIYPTERFSKIIDRAPIVDMKDVRKSPTAIFDLDENGLLTYYTLAISGQEEIAVNDRSQFESLLSVTTAQINSPPIVKVLPQERPKKGLRP